jgi:hypothetical protein
MLPVPNACLMESMICPSPFLSKKLFPISAAVCYLPSAVYTAVYTSGNPAATRTLLISAVDKGSSD